MPVGADDVKIGRRPLTCIYRSIQHVAATGDICALLFRHGIIVVVCRRLVIPDDNGNSARSPVPVAVRDGHGELVGKLFVVVRAETVFLSGRGECIGILQAPCCRIEARDLQISLACVHLDRRSVAPKHKMSIGIDHHFADNDGCHTVGGAYVHAPMGHCGGIFPCRVTAVGKAFLPDLKPVHHWAYASVIGVVGIVNNRDVRIQYARHDRDHAYAIVYIPVPVGIEIVLVLLAPVEADVEPAQTVDALQKLHIAILVEAAATGGSCSGRTCSRHEVGVAEGSKEVLAGDFRTLHLEARHLLLRVGSVEILQAYGGSVLKAQDKVVSVFGKECRV